MTETIYVEIPVVVDFDYTPADPDSNVQEEYIVRNVFFNGEKILLPLSAEAALPGDLRAAREDQIRIANLEYVCGPRGKYREAN